MGEGVAVNHQQRATRSAGSPILAGRLFRPVPSPVRWVDRSLMLVTALAPVIGYDKASRIAHLAMDNDLTLKAAALQSGFVTEAEFDRVVDPRKMVAPYIAGAD